MVSGKNSIYLISFSLDIAYFVNISFQCDWRVNLGLKEKVKLITELTEDISAATIYYRKKDAMRVAMKNAKTVIDDQDRARKAAVMGGVVASNKALDVALKQVKVLAPETPAIFFRRRHWLQPGICQRPSVSCQHSPGCWTWNPGGIKIRELVRIIPYWYFMFQDQAETFDEVVQHSDSPGQCDCCYW